MFKMMIFLLIIVSIHLCNVECLSCLTCQGIIQPRHCRAIEECDPTDTYCVTERVLDKHGQHVFNLGCRSDKICANVSVAIDESCRECCTRDLCNVEGCGQPGYPKDRGPICYDCPLSLADAQCKDITFCQTDEVCNFKSRYEFGDELFIRGCTDKRSCNPDNMPVVVGRRSSDINDLQFHCNRCCSSDLCNSECVVGTSKATDCYELLHVYNQTTSGVYIITLPGSGRALNVYCDMDTSGGGWTVFQHRASADVDFFRNMSEYVQGFGNVSGNFWLGPVMTETLAYNSGLPFSTYDVDLSNKCASLYHGAWWYGNCANVDLNGGYITPGTTLSGLGIMHIGFRDHQSLKQSNMMFRRN